MSDRRRYPPKDDWDDDLDLVGFERPTRSTPSPQPTAPRSSSGYEYEDEYLSEPAPRSRGSSSSQGGSGYGSPQSGYTGRYPSSSSQGGSRQQRPYQDDPYDRGGAGGDPYGSSGGYDSDPYVDPYAAGSRAAPATRNAPLPEQSYDDPYAASAYAEAGYAEAPYPETAPQRRTSRTREARSRSSVSVPKPAINDGLMIGIVAASLLSIVFMIASIAAGGGDLPEWFPLHLDAAGNPDLWGTDGTLWRIPFGAFMALIMALVIAAFLWKRDRFAARLAITGTAAIQVLAWVALIDFIW